MPDKYPTIEQIESDGKLVSARTARNTFDIGYDLLHLWRLRGCPHVRGGKIKARQETVLVPGQGGGVRTIWFYCRETLTKTADWFKGKPRQTWAPYHRNHRRHPKKVSDGKDSYLSLASAASHVGVS